jgi:hypothetical protein
VVDVFEIVNRGLQAALQTTLTQVVLIIAFIVSRRSAVIGLIITKIKYMIFLQTYNTETLRSFCESRSQSRFRSRTNNRCVSKPEGSFSIISIEY